MLHSSHFLPKLNIIDNYLFFLFMILFYPILHLFTLLRQSNYDSIQSFFLTLINISYLTLKIESIINQRFFNEFFHLIVSVSGKSHGILLSTMVFVHMNHILNFEILKIVGIEVPLY